MLTSAEVNRALAEKLGFKVEHFPESPLFSALSYPDSWDGHINAKWHPNEEVWNYMPAFTTDPAAALWAFREAEKRGGAIAKLVESFHDEDHPWEWLLLSGTAEKLARAALAAIEGE